MGDEFDFDGVVDNLGSYDQGVAPTMPNFGSFDFGPGLFNVADFQTPTAGYTMPAMPPMAMPPMAMPPVDFGSMDAGPALSSIDQAYLNQLNGEYSPTPQRGFLDYAKEYAPYLMSPNPLAAILINKLAEAAGNYAGGGTQGNLVSSGTSSLLSGASPQQALTNAALSELGSQTSQGISSLMPRSENPSLGEEFLNKAAPNVGAQALTALLTGNSGSLAPLIRNALIGTGKNMATNKVFGALTGD
jgi:hypothetical protein